jgi:hypothetical protein
MSFLLRFAKRVTACLSLFTALALTTGCAGSMDPARLQHERTSAYVFHHPAPDVEAAVRKLLQDGGFVLLDADRPGIVRTKWRAILDDEQFATEYERYIVVVQRLTNEHCRVGALKLSLATLGMETMHPQSYSGKGTNMNTVSYGKGKSPLLIGSPTARRDLDLEWSLITRKEPERARLMKSQIAWEIANR